MHGSTFVEVVCDFDFDPVTPVCLYERSRELSIDYEQRQFNAIRSHGPVRDLPFVVTSHTSVGNILLVVWVRIVLLSQTPRAALWQGTV